MSNIAYIEINFKRGNSMSTMSNKRLMIKVCELYYIQNKSQKEISALLGISRPQICRLITAARESEIVNISISNPYVRETELENRLIDRYSVSDTWVVDSTGEDGENAMQSFAREAARLIEDYIPQDSRVGVMSGYTGKAIIDSMEQSSKKLKLVVPLIGGISTTDRSVHADTLALKLAALHGASALNLNAPAVVSDSNLADSLKKEESIAKVLELGKKVDISLVGIGTLSPKATNIQLGSLREQDVEELQGHCAVASICSSYLNQDGQEVGEEITQRSIGVSLSDVKKSRIIAVAIGDSKVKAIKAVLKSGKIDVLVTDILTAKKVLEDES